MLQTGLQLEELESLFAALRENPQTPLTEALDGVIVLAKRKGMDAESLRKSLASYGIEGSPAFQAWLAKRFE